MQRLQQQQWSSWRDVVRLSTFCTKSRTPKIIRSVFDDKVFKLLLLRADEAPPGAAQTRVPQKMCRREMVFSYA